MEKKMVVVDKICSQAIINDWEIFGWEFVQMFHLKENDQLVFCRKLNIRNEEKLNVLFEKYERCRLEFINKENGVSNYKNKLLLDSLQMKLAAILSEAIKLR